MGSRAAPFRPACARSSRSKGSERVTKSMRLSSVIRCRLIIRGEELFDVLIVNEAAEREMERWW